MEGLSFTGGFRSEFEELLTWRRDVRRFRTDPLPDGTVDRLLSLAALAPSVGLSQPWRIVKVDAPTRRAAIREAFQDANAAALAGQAADRVARYARLKLAGLDQAPVHLALYSDETTEQGSGLGQATMPETRAYSVVAFIHTLWLAARIEGVGVGWVSIIDPARATAILEVSTDWRFVAYLCVGYPEREDDRPELERAGWEKRSGIEDFILQR